MKNIFKPFLYMGFTMFGFTACEDIKFGNEFLDKPNSNTVTIDKAFGSKFFAEQVLADCYVSLPDYLITDGRLQWTILETITDLADKGNNKSVYQSGSVNPSGDGYKNFPYRVDGNTTVQNPIYGIRKATIFLENVDRVPDMTPEEKAIRKGEALMIKAFHYCEMFRYMGGMPIMEHSFTPEDEVKFERLTVQAMVDRIVEMCDEAASLLPWRVDALDNGRFTAAAAKAIKFRVLLHAASPIFNNDQPYLAGEAADKHYVWYGNYDEARWQRALDAGLDFLKTNETQANAYQMVGQDAGLSASTPADFETLRANYRAGYSDRYNGEIIIEGHRYTLYDTSAKWAAQYRFSAFIPTIYLHNVFEMTDGTSFDWENATHAANPFFESMTKEQIAQGPKYDAVEVRDPRLYETLIVNGTDMQGRRIEIVTNNAEGPDLNKAWGIGKAAKSGMAMRKFVQDYRVQIKGKYYACPLMRMPEIYLGISECLNHLGKNDPSGKSAYDYLNIVRSRVGMPAVTPEKVAAGQDFTDYLLEERVREFAFEEVRYHDLCRYKRSDLFTRSSHLDMGLNTVAKSGGVYEYHSGGFNLPNTRSWLLNWSDKYYLVPVMEKEVNMGYGMVQNPGW